MKTVLVVEDEPQIAQIVRDYLQHAGFAVIMTGDGMDGLALTRERRPDLVVLDLGLPRLDGVDVARRLRREGDIPIIMLTARVEESDRLKADRCRLVVVETSSREDYAATRAFYERRGYGRVAAIPAYYAPGDDLVIYLKDLGHGVLAGTTA